MTYFNYHSKIQKLIREGKLEGYYFDYNYKNIGFALVLIIEGKKYPIREHKLEEYFLLIGEFYSTTKTKDNFFKTTKM